MRQLRCHANALSHHGLQLNFFANVYRVGTHLNRQSDLTDHVPRVRAHHVIRGHHG